MKINPPPTKFIIFSGGGGLVERKQKVSLTQGLNRFEIENVPAAFDPSTTTVFFPSTTGVTLQQVDVKRPDKRIIDNFISREKEAADIIIANATDLRGASREKILDLIESAHYRRYEDMFGNLIISIESKAVQEIELGIRYFLEDDRIKWQPSLHVTIDEETGTATVEGFILVMNNTDISYPRCELGFAEFETQGATPDTGFLDDLNMEQAAQNVMPRSRVMSQMKKASKVVY
ncbi:MAG: hypothetical protein FK733_19315 [Asgard group archaeon]|nr:hypothetical protein [Asgard group archaeon]